jgi:AhpD family alkylhydroperoxidase
MHPRINPLESAPHVYKHAAGLSQLIEESGVDKRLIELIKIRVSQINGCAFCIHMHTADARAMGETDTRMLLLSAWRESTLFSAKERAVLAWAESLTHVADKGAPDALYADLEAHFTKAEITVLTAATAMINFWNRMAIAMGSIHPAERGQSA